MTARRIFNPVDIIAACTAAKNNPKNEKNPLSEVFSINPKARPGANGCKYLDVYCKLSSGEQPSRLLVRFLDEKHSGVIPPLDEKTVNEINNKRHNSSFGPIKKRDRHPTINIQKYAAKVETDDNGNLKGSLPGDETKSKLFQVLEFLDEFFYIEMKSMLDSKKVVAHDPRSPVPEGAIVVASTKIVALIQTTISAQSKVNPGKKLHNPIARLNIKFDKDTGLSEAKFFDKSKPYQVPNSDPKKKSKTLYETLLFAGSPVTAQNVHKIESRSTVDGIVSLNAVCASNMGLSIPSTINALVVSAPVRTQVTQDDVYGDEDGTETTTSSTLTTTTPPSTTTAPLSNKVQETVSEKKLPPSSDTKTPPHTVKEDDLVGVLAEISEQ